MSGPTGWRQRDTVSVPEYAEIVGVSRTTAYDAAREGTIPTIRLRRRIVVPVAAILRQLGEERPAESPRETA